MRVIAGDWRGRKLIAPKGVATRPTADRTRETLFNMLASRVGSFNDMTVADLFAGSGALGLEALSRGAGSCLFVENDGEALKALKTNVAVLGADRRAIVQSGSVMSLGPTKVPHDLILLDPPYHTGAGIVALDRLIRLGWIGPQTLIAVETAFNEDVAVSGLGAETERKVGKAKITLLRPE
ncbi:16S rRNA (guanine(966)-N(2))-methyltransferase RsmD [Altererythrobacter aquiaggeris]|uniref:16S rRNA (guanine(966)-N(2))-methyltransferase RsmD n=1 Tax=Aestuarierythrobacter aquiaggeris TaxID=1898396 RepID=UPI00301678E9